MSPSSQTSKPDIILFWYDISVYSRRMDYYLTLRKLRYKRCIQPPQIPRPDLQALGIKYRRMPILAIGRDIYCDTRLIIEELEEMYPEIPKLGSDVPFEKGLEKVFESWVISSGPFWRTAGCIPLSAPILKDENFVRDRAESTGGRFTLENLAKGKAECLTHLRIYFGIAENLLADGRQYILGTKQPGLADVHSVWTFDWGIHIAMFADLENVGEEVLNERSFPAVFAWVERFRAASKMAEQKTGVAPFITSEDAVREILESLFVELAGKVDPFDPLGLVKGQRVTVSANDYGSGHIDEGILVKLGTTEVVIASIVPGGEDGLLNLHFPRHDFTIEPVEDTT